jgi:hypothetical protein
MKWHERIRQAWASRRARKNSVQPVTPTQRTTPVGRAINKILSLRKKA